MMEGEQDSVSAEQSRAVSCLVTVDQEEEGHLDGLLLLVEMTLILALILHSDRAQSEDPGVQGLKVDRNTG